MKDNKLEIYPSIDSVYLAYNVHDWKRDIFSFFQQCSDGNNLSGFPLDYSTYGRAYKGVLASGYRKPKPRHSGVLSVGGKFFNIESYGAAGAISTLGAPVGGFIASCGNLSTYSPHRERYGQFRQLVKMLSAIYEDSEVNLYALDFAIDIPVSKESISISASQAYDQRVVKNSTYYMFKTSGDYDYCKKICIYRKDIKESFLRPLTRVEFRFPYYFLKRKLGGESMKLSDLKNVNSEKNNKLAKIIYEELSKNNQILINDSQCIYLGLEEIKLLLANLSSLFNQDSKQKYSAYLGSFGCKKRQIKKSIAKVQIFLKEFQHDLIFNRERILEYSSSDMIRRTGLSRQFVYELRRKLSGEPLFLTEFSCGITKKYVDFFNESVEFEQIHTPKYKSLYRSMFFDKKRGDPPLPL